MYSVYVLKSQKDKSKMYIGFTKDLQARIKAHNNGQSVYTKEYKPWTLICSHDFLVEKIAKNFEKYLKSGSGKAFIKKHFL